MTIFINGEARKIAAQMKLTELLNQFTMPQERIAVELNKQVVRKKDWAAIQINDADRIEIIHFVGGG